MKYIIGMVMLLTCTACGPKYVYIDPPALPELPAAVAEDCPGLTDVADRATGTLALADQTAALLYAECREEKRVAVRMYNEARDARTQKPKK